MSSRVYYPFRKYMVEELREKHEEPYAFWYDYVQGEFLVYQNDKDGREELLFKQSCLAEAVG